MCSQSVLSASFQGVKLWIHLKSHPQEWNSYLCADADAISANIPKSSGPDCLKLVALIVVEEWEFNLRVPVCRIMRDSSNSQVVEVLAGFKQRVLLAHTWVHMTSINL